MQVQFPELGLEFWLNRVAISINGFSIYWYAVLITSGAVLGILYAFKVAKNHGVNDDDLLDVIFVAVITGILGARIYYVVFQWDYFQHNLTEILNIRSGGIAIYGGIIGGILGGYIVCRIKKIKVIPILDIAGVSLLVAQGIGRWGNFVNQEAFGFNTTSIFGMYSEATNKYLTEHQESLAQLGMIVDPSLPVHPTFLYESVWCIVGAILLAIYSKHRKFDGEIALMYAAWYGLGRFFIEGLRTDSLMIGSFRVSQLLALVCVIVSAFAIIHFRKKQKLVIK